MNPRGRLIALCMIGTLAACGPERVEFAKPPPDKLVCPDEPAVPAAPVTDEANGEYLKSLRNSWYGCRSDVDWLRTWFKTLNHE